MGASQLRSRLVVVGSRLCLLVLYLPRRLAAEQRRRSGCETSAEYESLLYGEWK